MMRMTASIVAQTAADGAVKLRGAVPRGKAIDAGKFVTELARRNIKIAVSES